VAGPGDAYLAMNQFSETAATLNAGSSASRTDALPAETSQAGRSLTGCGDAQTEVERMPFPRRIGAGVGAGDDGPARAIRKPVVHEASLKAASAQFRDLAKPMPGNPGAANLMFELINARYASTQISARELTRGGEGQFGQTDPKAGSPGDTVLYRNVWLSWSGQGGAVWTW
jgi:hypothetical protein